MDNLHVDTYDVETIFDHAGCKCVVIIDHRGYRCGYVGIDNTHFLYGKERNDHSPILNMLSIKSATTTKPAIVTHTTPGGFFKVHGDINFSSGGKDSTYPILGDWWWYGYDCCHAFDYREISAIRNDVERVLMSRLQSSYPDMGVVRSLEYCIAQCKNLAEQLQLVQTIYDNEIKEEI